MNYTYYKNDKTSAHRRGRHRKRTTPRVGPLQGIHRPKRRCFCTMAQHANLSLLPHLKKAKAIASTVPTLVFTVSTASQGRLLHARRFRPLCGAALVAIERLAAAGIDECLPLGRAVVKASRFRPLCRLRHLVHIECLRVRAFALARAMERGS